MTNVLEEGYAETKALVVALYNKFQAIPDVQTVETDIKTDAITLEQWVVTNGYPMLMQDALALVTGELTGTPWATLIATLISQAKAQSVQLKAGVAQVALNLAESQLIVAGAKQPVTPTTPAPEAPAAAPAFVAGS